MRMLRMPRFDIAHIQEQGQDIIIVPLDRTFNQKIQSDPEGITAEVAGELQMRANSAGLRGTVVLVWEDPLGRMKFRAPKAWHLFFGSLTMDQILRSVNRYIEW